MHIEKNVSDSIIGTLMNLDGKTKDNINSHFFYLKCLGIRAEFHVTMIGEGKYAFLHAHLTRSSKEKYVFCQFLVDLKVPDGYLSYISRCIDVNEGK